MANRSVVVRGASCIGCLFFLVYPHPLPQPRGECISSKPATRLTSISRLFGVDLDRLRERIASQAPTSRRATGSASRTNRRSRTPVVEVPQHREVNSDRVLQAVCRDETVYHAVARGETLSAIANRYDTDLENLLRLNGLRKTSVSPSVSGSSSGEAPPARTPSAGGRRSPASPRATGSTPSRSPG